MPYVISSIAETGADTLTAHLGAAAGDVGVDVKVDTLAMPALPTESESAAAAGVPGHVHSPGPRVATRVSAARAVAYMGWHPPDKWVGSSTAERASGASVRPASINPVAAGQAEGRPGSLVRPAATSPNRAVPECFVIETPLASATPATRIMAVLHGSPLHNHSVRHAVSETAVPFGSARSMEDRFVPAEAHGPIASVEAGARAAAIDAVSLELPGTRQLHETLETGLTEKRADDLTDELEDAAQDVNRWAVAVDEVLRLDDIL